MIYIVKTWSGLVGMTAAELNHWVAIPDHRGLRFDVETAESEDEHACAQAQEADARLDPAAWGMR